MTSLLAVLLIAPFMAQADATIANVATPSISAELGASGAELELVIGGYLVAFAVLLITGARLGQTHGYRHMFLAGIAVFTGASALSGLAPTPAVLIAARVLQGAGAALMFPQTLTGIQLAFTGPARVRAIGLYAIALSAGAVSGQLLGGALISADLLGSGWRAIFLVNVPIGLVALVAGARRLPADDHRASRRIDLRGVAALSVAVLLVVLPLVLGRADGWPAWTWVCFAASVPALALFVATQRGRAEPLLNLHALAPRPVAFGLAAVAAATATYYALLFTLALYLQQGLGRSPLVSGLTLVSWVAAFGLAGQIVRRAGAPAPRGRSRRVPAARRRLCRAERQPVRGRALRGRSGGAAGRGRARARAAVQRPRRPPDERGGAALRARHQRRVDHGHADRRRRGRGRVRDVVPGPGRQRRDHRVRDRRRRAGRCVAARVRGRARGDASPGGR
jgi:MFS family permease